MRWNKDEEAELRSAFEGAMPCFYEGQDCVGWARRALKWAAIREWRIAAAFAVNALATETSTEAHWRPFVRKLETLAGVTSLHPFPPLIRAGGPLRVEELGEGFVNLLWDQDHWVEVFQGLPGCVFVRVHEMDDCCDVAIGLAEVDDVVSAIRGVASWVDAQGDGS